MRIKHYVTAFANDVVKLDRAVNELLAKGYQPYGDPYVADSATTEPERFLACQAMVSYEESLPPAVGSPLV
jgi:hypothetical protein